MFIFSFSVATISYIRILFLIAVVLLCMIAQKSASKREYFQVEFYEYEADYFETSNTWSNKIMIEILTN